jgi:uncharacterized membrane protein
MPKAVDFFSSEEEQRIVQAIRQAEKNSSAEIRVHLEHQIPKNIQVAGRAVHLFYQLKMDKTAQRNGVLFYFAIQDKQFAVFGDHGIDKKVTEAFWVKIKNEVVTSFKKQDYISGLINGIYLVGEELKTHFPYDKAIDINELSDEISKS